MNLGARIKLVREEMNLEQGDIVEMTGGVISQQALSNLETRDSKTSEHLFLLADTLGVSARWLMTGEGEKHPPPETPIGDLFPSISVDEWRSLTDRERGFVEGKLHSAIELIVSARGKLKKSTPLLTAPQPEVVNH